MITGDAPGLLVEEEHRPGLTGGRKGDLDGGGTMGDADVVAHGAPAAMV